MTAIREYETTLSAEILRSLAELDGVTVYGVKEKSLLHRRVPTICFTVKGISSAHVATHCARNGIGVRDGNMYSPRLLRRMNIPTETGVIRASLVHYNTVEEVIRFAEILRQMIQG
jgi:selenocysteine lyase/cysteine desulfurase